MLRLARTAFARWRALADRLPPAELVDQVLDESAYAYELRGRGHAQARENLKKLRGLVRRLQNRGYATLGRIAERVSQLMSGDESNAIVDAADAVNLMTVHAAKGLEFPIVFVVNLSRGTGGRGDVVDVVTGTGGDGAVVDLVAVDGLADEPAREVEAREREETKRLVYVALTRARDRLYLGADAVAPGRLRPGAVVAAARCCRRRSARRWRGRRARPATASSGRQPVAPSTSCRSSTPPARWRHRRPHEATPWTTSRRSGSLARTAATAASRSGGPVTGPAGGRCPSAGGPCRP